MGDTAPAPLRGAVERSENVGEMRGKYSGMLLQNQGGTKRGPGVRGATGRNKNNLRELDIWPGWRGGGNSKKF